jgi:hypothetical protein
MRGLSIIVALSAASLLIGCKGPQGPTGPAGPQGAAGPQGRPVRKALQDHQDQPVRKEVLVSKGPQAHRV